MIGRLVSVGEEGCDEEMGKLVDGLGKEDVGLDREDDKLGSEEEEEEIGPNREGRAVRRLGRAK